MNKLKAAVLHYLFGVIASAFNGGISSVTAFLGEAGYSAATQISGNAATHTMDAKDLFHTFIGAAVIHALFYFKSHPVPEALPPDLFRAVTANSPLAPLLASKQQEPLPGKTPAELAALSPPHDPNPSQ